MRRWSLLASLLVVRLAAAGPADAWATGTVGLAHQLLRLQTTARVLHTGAHPDDEDSALIASLARGAGARVAYLSLNRGEGGQNGIGPELADALGVLRTAELLAARDLDGAEQCFANVFDFGFSKTAAETLRFWGAEATLGDVVATIRRFRPHVIISRFAGEPSDGHGHHQVAGQLTRQAFRLAADPQAFPAQLAAGLQPWQANRLYLDRYQGTDGACRIDAGAVSPLYGRSFAVIAAAGRSQHRSQDMGRAGARGPAVIRLALVDAVPPAAPTAGLLDGLPVTLTDLVPEPKTAGGWQTEAHQRLAEAADAVKQAQALFALNLYPRQSVVALARALRALRRAVELVPERDATWVAVRAALEQKVGEASEALALAAGLELDALADQATVAPGGQMTVVAQAFWPDQTPVSAVRLNLELPAGWAARPLETPPLLGNGAPQAMIGATVTAPADAAASQPYWLRAPREGQRFAADPALAGRPFEPPLLRIRFRGVIENAVVSLDRPVTFRSVDLRRGERRQEVQVRPALSATAQPDLVLLRPGHGAPTVAVTVRNHTAQEARGDVVLQGSAGPLATAPVVVAAAATSTATLELPATAPGGEAQVLWQAGGRTTPLSTVHAIRYEHVPERQYLTPTRVRLAPVTVELTPDRPIGCVPGPGDDLAPALAALGAAPRLIDPATLDRPETLAGLTTVVVGSRAYEVSESLVRHNARLLSWARAGGTLVVMYQKHPYAAGNLAPLPLTIAQPHDRVTDETAAVTLLQPEHPLLSRPNRLGPDDFAGWVQERGLYFWHTWDEAYRPLLACADPGEEPQRGGLLVAPLGQGAYVYCGYALFRQLPAGVPGAYRLLANLVSYAR